MTGKFITFEGVDGAGKSTHLAWFTDRLRGRGLEVVSTREPGGTPVGERLREILLECPMDLETEALLMFAARREHLSAVILPALDAGKWVICDRFTDATFAYQGGGRELDWEKIRALERWVQSGFGPDLTLIFDCPVAVARQRLAGTGVALDRFEREEEAFHERVRAAYHRRAAEEPARVRMIDASNTIEHIRKELEDIIITI